jgi:hypothetical protein
MLIVTLEEIYMMFIQISEQFIPMVKFAGEQNMNHYLDSHNQYFLC